MSVLIAAASPARGEALVARLRAAGDEVRVIEEDEQRARRWATLGAHVARGDPTDPDLVARAARGARTLVVLDEPPGDRQRALVIAAVEAAVDDALRIVVCAPRIDESAARLLRRSPVEHVLLTTPERRGLVTRHTLSDEVVAEAVDASDDLASPTRLELDLGAPEAWAELGLAPPRRFSRGSGRRAP
jgi:Trk K+ transport system NAD-binding subunit